MRDAREVAKVRAAEAKLMAALPDGTLMRRAATGLAAVCAQLLGHVYGSRAVVLAGSGNYDFKGELAYHLSDHWFAGGFLSLNNTRDYNSQVAGFFIRFTSRPQVEYDNGPTGLYSWDGLRPYLAP